MSEKPDVHDATAWTGQLPGGWPRAIDHPEPWPIQARESLTKSIVVASLLLYAGIAQWLPFSQERHIQIAPALVFLLGGLFMAARSFRILRQSKTVLMLDERGLTWPGGYERTIPWSEIERAERNYWVFFPLPWFPGIYISVRDRQRYAPRFLGMAVSASTGNLEGLRPLPWLLDVKSRDIFKAIEAYRAYYGRAEAVRD